MPGAIAQGLIWGIMAIGVYITYRILDVADLTVDGSLATGGAVCVMLMRGRRATHGLALLCAFLAGMLAGLCHRSAPHPVRHPRHSGRYSDPAGAVLRQSADHGQARPTSPSAWISMTCWSPSATSGMLALNNPIPLVILFLAVCDLACLYWFFGTEQGCSLRATGANPNMARAQGINTNVEHGAWV